MSLDLEAIKAHADKAHDHVCDIAQQKARWRMSIPAQPDYDSDLLITSALMDVDALLAEVERLTVLYTRLDADNAQLAGENQTLTEQLAAATLEQP